MSSLAEHIETIKLYVEHGCEPGGCTTAILAGDLFGALARADFGTEQNLGNIARYIVNHTPAGCWGSYAAVTAWRMRKKREAARSEGQRGNEG